MKVIIAGDRNIKNVDDIANAVEKSGFEITTVLCGEAKGADKLGDEWAKTNKIPVKYYPAQWNKLDVEGAVVKERQNPFNKKMEKYNQAAGSIRNQEMVDNADALIALQNLGTSPGTQDCIKRAKKKGIKIYVYTGPEDYEFDFGQASKIGG